LFTGKAFFSKKAAFVKVIHNKLQVAGSDWSEKFSLDVAGSGGSVTCKSPIFRFQLGIEIQLSSWGLTKYVIFTPRYYLVNQCTFQVSVKEEQKPDHIVKVSPNACIPFWPESMVPHLLAIIQTDDYWNETKAFKYDSVRHSLLQLRGKVGGLHVDIHFSEAKTVITFSEFIPGQAPALLVNGTNDCPLEVSEQGMDEIFMLLPRMCQMFTWKNPLGSRVLNWSAVAADRKPQGSDKLFGDGCGTFNSNGKPYFWISFLDGLQRVILFSSDVELTTYLQGNMFINEYYLLLFNTYLRTPLQLLEKMKLLLRNI
jgi:vacuolar protein sorting-associated protein 13A/C